MGVSKPRVLTGKQVVAGQRKLKAAGYSGAVNRANNRLRALLQCHNKR